MGAVLSKFCKCIFCCCPNYNCYNRKEREIEIIYQKIRSEIDSLENEVI